MSNQFLLDVDKGLSSDPKFLSSRYFYDELGDQLFVQIMHMPEYYLTNAEYEILKEQTNIAIESLQLKKDQYFELIELGAGDGTKTKVLLKELLHRQYNFEYFPIDISQHALDSLKQALNKEMPELSVRIKQGEYFKVLESLKQHKQPKVVLFLGSNLGNLSDEQAHDFIYKLGSNLNTRDKLILGVDLIKSEKIVLPAYDDAEGITAKFNLNLLNRINRELDANFNLNAFEHEAEYTEKEGIARSYIVSKVNQEVTIKAIGKTFGFKLGERIHTEVSRKYNDKILQKILDETDFVVVKKLIDSNNYFADYIIEKR